MAKKHNNITDEKHDNFKRLAKSRTNRALKAISLLGNLRSSRYHSSQDELDKVTDTIQEGLDLLKSKYRPKLLSLDFEEEE